MRKLDRLAADFPDIYKLIRQTDIDKTYSMPKSYNLLLAEDLVTRKPRKISEEQRDTGKVMEHHFGGRCWKSIQTAIIGRFSKNLTPDLHFFLSDFKRFHTIKQGVSYHLAEK